MNSTRIVVTIPPEKWFGGADRRIAYTLLRQLEQRFGGSFYQLDTTPFIVKGEEAGQQDSLANLKAYNPQLAISLNNAGYGLACVLKDGESSPNLFTDILNIPLMLLWDHGLFQFPAIALSPLATEPTESTGDAIRRVREKINHPLMYHYPIDSGQVGEMRRIGLLRSRNVAAMPSLAYQPFIEYGRKHAERHYINDVAFAGNVYLSDQYAANVDQWPIAARCHRDVLAAKRAQPAVPAWTLVAKHVEALSASEKRESCLDYDQTFFWYFINQLIGIQCNTQMRVQVLESITQPVAFYGAFVDPAGIPRLRDVGRVEYKGNVDYADELPRVYAQSRILVDVTNAPFMTNCSTKPICCFAAGGFCLFDFKPDAAAHLGSESEKIMYRSTDDLNTKIEYFLSHEREREELGAYFGDFIRRERNFADSVYNPAARILSKQSSTWSRLKGSVSKTLNSLRKGRSNAAD